MSCLCYKRNPNDYCFTIVRRVEGDGHEVAYRKCNKCGQNWDGRFIAKEKVNFSSLPFDKAMPVCICQRCGKRYAQRHHYFPRALARIIGEDPDTWPTQDLCGECHAKWHNSVTPGLVKKDW